MKIRNVLLLQSNDIGILSNILYILKLLMEWKQMVLNPAFHQKQHDYSF